MYKLYRGNYYDTMGSWHQSKRHWIFVRIVICDDRGRSSCVTHVWISCCIYKLTCINSSMHKQTLHGILDSAAQLIFYLYSATLQSFSNVTEEMVFISVQHFLVEFRMNFQCSKWGSWVRVLPYGLYFDETWRLLLHLRSRKP